MHSGWSPLSGAGPSWHVARLRRTVALVLFSAGVIGLLVLPDAAAQATTDYDQDDDGLIEVDRLARLDVIRWDMDGDGAADNPTTSTNHDDPDDNTVSTQGEAYAAAFPNPATGMGCRLADDDGDTNTPDVPVCIGYELAANLNFSGSTWASGGQQRHHQPQLGYGPRLGHRSRYQWADRVYRWFGRVEWWGTRNQRG